MVASGGMTTNGTVEPSCGATSTKPTTLPWACWPRRGGRGGWCAAAQMRKRITKDCNDITDQLTGRMWLYEISMVCSWVDRAI
jgi:hypothetical protein